jgi:hypothetical protein
MLSTPAKPTTMSDARVDIWITEAVMAEKTISHTNPASARRMGLDLQRADTCHSTTAVIQHAEDDGEEVTSKTTSAPKKSLWGAVKEFFTLRRGPSPFANYPPHMF